MPAHTAPSRGYVISYEVAGKSNPVLLIPGYMQTASRYREAGYVDRLADRWQVLAMDPLGHGRSDKPHDSQPYRSPGVAADVVAVLDAAGVERAVLWGYSRGAWLAAMAAIENPARLSGLIIGGGAFTEPPATTIPNWVGPLSRGDWPEFWSLFPIPLQAEQKAQIEADNDPLALAAERIGRIQSAYTFDLRRVTVPALVYCGGEDEPAEAVPTAEALHTQLRVIEGCDHVGAFKAVDQVMEVAIPFLESLSPVRGTVS